jgi:hypothetical protein
MTPLHFNPKVTLDDSIDDTPQDTLDEIPMKLLYFWNHHQSVPKDNLF